MVELRTFEGDAEEASRFINGVWQERYGKKLPLAVWDARFFDWLLFREGQAPRDYLVAAYDGGQLVGTLFAEPARLRLGTREVDGTYGSWASVAPSHRGQGIGGKLAEELFRRHRDRGAMLTLGCVAAGTDGPGFWKQTEHARFLGGLGLWVHVFDAQALARWSMHASERALFTMARPFLRHRFRQASGQDIRPYRPSDLPRCMALLQRMMAPVTLGYAYTVQRLAHQLQYRDVPHTFVLEQAGEVQGFVNSYPMRMTGRETMTAEVVDLMAFADSVSHDDRRRLLQVAMQDMERRGASCAAMLRTPCIPASLMWRSGWVPFPGGAKVTCLLPSPQLELPASPCVFTHLR